MSAQESVRLDELDLAVLNALQISPRAPWARIASVLGIDPVTVARRWDRLATAGHAWIACYPGPAESDQICTAFVEVDCRTGTAECVAYQLARHPQVATIEHTSGGRDLLLTVFTRDTAALSRFLLDSLGSLAGVLSTNAQLVTRIFAEGSRWQLRALDAEQRAALTAKSVVTRPARLRRPSWHDRDLLMALMANGRATYTALAAHLDCSIATIRRRMDALIDTDRLTLRCELARPLTGWPVSATLWARVPAEALDATADLIGSLPETRLCAALTGGASNLLFSVWLRAVSDVQALETQLTRRVRRLTIVDRAIALSHVKRMGHILDTAGRSRTVVPVDLWSDHPPQPGG